MLRRRLAELAGAAQAPPDWASPLGQLQIVFALFLVLVCYGLCRQILAARQNRRAPPRDLGLRLRGRNSPHAIHRVQLRRGTGETRPPDAGVHRALGSRSRASCRPPVRSIRTATTRWKMAGSFSIAASGVRSPLFRWIQSGNIRHYVLYLFAAVVFYLLCALVW